MSGFIVFEIWPGLASGRGFRSELHRRPKFALAVMMLLGRIRVAATPRRRRVNATPPSHYSQSQFGGQLEAGDEGVAATPADAASPLPGQQLHRSGLVGQAAVAKVLAGFGWLFLLLLLAGVAVPAHASVIAVERADYGVTNAINGLNGGSGWGSAWTGNNNVAAGSLSRPSVPTAGNRFTTDGNNVGSFRLLATAGQGSLLTPGGEFGKEGTTIWVSCLMRRDTDSGAGSGRYAGLSFFHNGGAEELLIGIPWEAANWGIHFHDLGASAPGLSATPIANGTTVWLVAKISFGVSGTSDRVDLFVNPSPTAAPTTPAVTRSGGNIQFTVVRLTSGNTSTTVSFDELRIGTTWADVSPATEQNFPLPLGTEDVHSVGIFKLEKFTQSTPGAVSGVNSARFEVYAFNRPENFYPPWTNWIGVFGPAGSLAQWELTSVMLQTIDPVNDYEWRRQFLDSGPLQFPQPPEVEFATRAAMDAIWPDGPYRFSLSGSYSDPLDPINGIQYPIGEVELNIAGTAYPAAAPMLANFSRLQAWPRTQPLEFRWQPFSGAGPADFIQVVVQRTYTSAGFTRFYTPLAAEPNAIPGTATNFFAPESNNLGTTADGAFATVTFFNVTRINTNEFPGCVGIAGFARQTTFDIHFVDPVVPTISVFPTNHVEGSGSAHALDLEVRLSLPSNTEVSINYATGDESAVAGQDYQATTGTLVFAPGETSKLVQVPILPDTTPEPDETFKLVLSSPVIGTIAQGQAQATILNDDGGSNTPPQVANPIADSSGTYGTLLNFSIAADAFTDPDAGQTLTYSASGLPPGITFTSATRTFNGTPTATGTASVSVTAMDNGSPAMSTNDVFDIVIAHAPLTVTANNTNRVYGVPNPDFTGSLLGVVNNDNITAAFSTTATIADPPGTYPITPELSDPDGRLVNYMTTTNQGTFTITSPPELSFTTGGDGGGLFTLSWPASYTGFILESAESLSPPITWLEITSGITETGGIKSYTVASDPGVQGRLYRLRLP